MLFTGGAGALFAATQNFPRAAHGRATQPFYNSARVCCGYAITVNALAPSYRRQAVN